MELPENLPSDGFKTQFQRRLEQSQFADAKEAFGRLQKAGCDPSVLMACLEVYSSHIEAQREGSPSDSYIPEFLQNNDSLVAEAEKLAIDLEENANRIQQLNQTREIRRELTLWDERNPNLTDDLRAHASWLKSTADKIRSPFSLRDQPGQVLNYASGYIKKITGKESITDLTKLVRAAYAAVGIDDDVDDNTLGKVVRRARRRRR
jgi:hypothetical protein